MRWGRLVVATGLVGGLLGTAAGIVGATDWLGADDATAAAPLDVRVVDGGVSALGAAEGTPQDWSARQTAPGRYEVQLPGAPVAFELTAWDAVADAVQTPLAGGGVEVRFTRALQPVDSRFTFRAVVLP